MRGLARLAAAGTLGVLAAFTTAAGAAVFPYQNDFGSAGLPNTAPAANWSLSGGTFNNVSGGAGVAVTVNTASEQVTGVNQDFVVISRVTLNSATPATNGTQNTIGFGIFGAAGNFAGTYYLIDWAMVTNGSGPGTLRITRQGGGSLASFSNSTSNGGGFSGGSVPLGTEFLLKVTGTYSGPSLSMTFGVWDSSGTTQIGGTATATDNSPLSGEFFGYRNRSPGNNSSHDVSFNDFNVVPVPEPAFTAAFAAAGAMLLRRRRPTARQTAGSKRTLLTEVS